MFEIKCLNQNVEQKKLITSGITFGFYDMPLFFEVKSPLAEKPLMIIFLLEINKDKKPYELSLGKIENNEMKITFSSPSKDRNGGLAQPIGIVMQDKDMLAFMFFCESLGINSNCYKLSYEFYHGKTD